MEDKKHQLSDEYMIFDETKGRYILTSEYVLDSSGINLATRLKTKGMANPQATVNGFLDRISVLTYRYITDHSINSAYRKHLVAHCPSARPIIQEAMLSQLLYVLAEGDLTLSSDKEKRAMWFDESARSILLTPLREVGYCLLYCGA